MPLVRSNFAHSMKSNPLWTLNARRTMRHIIVAATIGAVAFVAGGTATAADIPAPQVQVQPPPSDYYPNPPVAEPYPYPPPVAYGYPPPPAYYYEYGPPPPVVVPRPYYFARRVYEDHPYGPRSFGPYFARGYGRYEHQWGRRGW